MAQLHTRGARGRALSRAVQFKLRQSAKWAESELHALGKAHRRFVSQLREALQADRCAARQIRHFCATRGGGARALFAGVSEGSARRC